MPAQAPTDNPLTELEERRQIWANKPQIRLVYERWMRLMKPYISDGALLEVGSGSGLTRDLLPGVILCDIVKAPWLNFAADCLRLPIRTGSVGCVLCFDLLHHTANPHIFLNEAARVLRPGGRILLMEPYITAASWLGYRLLHHEDVYFGSDYHNLKGGEKVDPWQGNLAMANIVFNQEANEWPRLHPDLKITHRELLSFIDFQFAAGFKPYSYTPMELFKNLVKLDDVLGFMMPLIAFRVFIVLEKT